MKKLIILTLGIFLAFTQNVIATPAPSEVNGTLDTSGVSTGLEIGLPCSPASVSNGTVNATTCVISCNTGYTLSGNSCTINSSSSSSGGGGGGGWSGVNISTGTTTNTGTGLIIQYLTSVDTSLSGTITTITGSINNIQNLIGSLDLGNTQLNGSSQTAQITGESGSVILSPNKDSNIRLVVPAGVSVTGNTSWDGKLSAPYVIQQNSKGIIIKVGNDISGLTFSKPVTIEIDTDLPEGTQLEIYFTVDGKNLEQMMIATVKNGKITFTTTHFSYFIVKVLAASSINFIDISDSFAKEYIIRLANLGVIKGFNDKTFRPNNSATRAEFLAMVMKTYNISVDEKATTTFTDIPTDGPWMIKYIEKAKEFGIKGQVVKGKAIFRPNDPVSRAEALAILFNIAKISITSTKTLEFTDVTTTWMIPYTIKAKELGIANGQTINGKLMFRPNDPITRAETTTIIIKSVDLKK